VSSLSATQRYRMPRWASKSRRPAASASTSGRMPPCSWSKRTGLANPCAVSEARPDGYVSPAMTANIELGPVGAVVEPTKDGAFVDAAQQLEQLGFPTIWMTGGPLDGLGQLGQLVEGTSTARIASGIIAADRFPADEVAAFWTDMQARHPGRFVLGLGGARGPGSFPGLHAYLNRLDELGVLAGGRILAALGPRSLDLARAIGAARWAS
jgi:hypothetical protein